MAKFVLFCMCVLGVIGFGGRTYGQTTSATPTQADINRQLAEQQQADRMRQQRELLDVQTRSNQQRTQRDTKDGVLSATELKARELARKNAILSIEALYRKSTKEELQFLAPDKTDFDRYAVFLRQSNTGLIKLAADKGCSNDTKIVVGSTECQAYTMPGAGNSYSFRVRDYRISRISDLTFTSRSFEARGILQQGILVNIGDVSLEQVTLQTRGLKYLVDFAPEADRNKALDNERKFTKGLKNDGFVYARNIDARENTTYILRSIAYRGRYIRSVLGMDYDEMGFDKRKDVIVAFRIVERHTDGSVTILWKRLAERDSPKIKWDNLQFGEPGK